jgi:hypothetical protein
MDKDSQDLQDQEFEDLERQVEALPVYERTVNTGLMLLGEVLLLILNRHDRTGLETLKKAVDEMFTNAENALDDKRHVQ